MRIDRHFTDPEKLVLEGISDEAIHVLCAVMGVQHGEIADGELFAAEVSRADFVRGLQKLVPAPDDKTPR